MKKFRFLIATLVMSALFAVSPANMTPVMASQTITMTKETLYDLSAYSTVTYDIKVTAQYASSSGTYNDTIGVLYGYKVGTSTREKITDLKCTSSSGSDSPTFSKTYTGTINTNTYDRVMATFTKFRSTGSSMKLICEEAPPKITKITTPVTFTKLTNNTISATATNYTSLKWQISTDGSTFSNLANSGVWSGTTTATLKAEGNYAAISDIDGAYVRLSATNDAGTTYSNAVKINVNLSDIPKSIDYQWVGKTTSNKFDTSDTTLLYTPDETYQDALKTSFLSEKITLKNASSIVFKIRHTGSHATTYSAYLVDAAGNTLKNATPSGNQSIYAASGSTFATFTFTDMPDAASAYVKVSISNSSQAGTAKTSYSAIRVYYDDSNPVAINGNLP